MSKQAARVGDAFMPGTGTAGAAASNAVMDSMTPDIPSQDVPVRGADDVKKQTEQVATRDQQQRVALAASGVTATQNERDALGGALNRRSASRLLLGGR